ncbi:hypothetical protein WN944_008704 [Citrus x changshan-huyou]|uniref:Uncharacterized protein n=1 Tax=Citrus x changshan-huyou TaxID=2935761 RepID=A0AAP0MNG9_9ROSI
MPVSAGFKLHVAIHPLPLDNFRPLLCEASCFLVLTLSIFPIARNPPHPILLQISLFPWFLLQVLLFLSFFFHLFLYNPNQSPSLSF